MKHYRTAGFTLVEMAIVLMIVGLLLGGMLVPLSAQMEQRNISETRKQLDEIQQALIGFAVINRRLPCPADGTIATSPLNNAGSEIVGGCAAGASGVLPWLALGVRETDAWGRRFTYRVTPAFAVVFTLADAATLDIGTTNPLVSTDVALDVPAVVISHGPNGLGAYTPTGGPPPTIATDAHELDNVPTNNDDHFVSHDFVQHGFDDMVTWLSPNTLFNRMVTAGRLP